MHFVTKAMLIINVDLVSVARNYVNLLRICSISHTRYIHVNAFGCGHTDTHAYKHHIQKQFQETNCTPKGLWPAHV